MEVCGINIDFEKQKGYFLNADCMKGMKEFPDKYFDLAIVDPPYGISITQRHPVKNGSVLVGGGGRPFGGLRHNNRQIKNTTCKSKFYHPFDDTSAPNGEYFKEVRRVSKSQIIWGGNFFLDYLGRTTCMIVWDKCRRGLDQADCELAWTNLKGQSRIFTFKWNGMLQEDMKNKEQRIHPTQKPVKLYEWILRNYAEPGYKILDTHVGSASSLIACKRLNFDFVGFEIDKEYYRLACERIARETAQMTLTQYLGEMT